MPIFNAERSGITRAYHSPRGMIGTVDRKDLPLKELTPHEREIIGNDALIRATIIEVRGGSWFFHSRPIFEASRLEGSYVIASGDQNRHGLGDWYNVYSDGRVELSKAVMPIQERVGEVSDPILNPRGRERFSMRYWAEKWFKEEQEYSKMPVLYKIPKKKIKLFQTDTSVGIETVDEEGSTRPVLRYTELIVEYPTPFDIISLKFPKKNLTQ